MFIARISFSTSTGITIVFKTKQKKNRKILMNIQILRQNWWIYSWHGYWCELCWQRVSQIAIHLLFYTSHIYKQHIHITKCESVTTTLKKKGHICGTDYRDTFQYKLNWINNKRSRQKPFILWLILVDHWRQLMRLPAREQRWK